MNEHAPCLMNAAAAAAGTAAAAAAAAAVRQVYVHCNI